MTWITTNYYYHAEKKKMRTKQLSGLRYVRTQVTLGFAEFIVALRLHRMPLTSLHCYQGVRLAAAARARASVCGSHARDYAQLIFCFLAPMHTHASSSPSSPGLSHPWALCFVSRGCLYLILRGRLCPSPPPSECARVFCFQSGVFLLHRSSDVAFTTHLRPYRIATRARRGSGLRHRTLPRSSIAGPGEWFESWQRC
jgi:hypothetical protein